MFESVYLSQRVVVMTARPGRVFTELAVEAPYPRDERFRTSAEYAAALPQGLADACARNRGGAMSAGSASEAERARSDRVLRTLLPVLVLAGTVLVWHLVVRW